MKIVSIILSIFLLLSCKETPKGEKFPIEQNKFLIEYLPYLPEGDYVTYKFRVKHFYNRTLSKVELTLDGYDENEKLYESGKASEENMLMNEERIFHIRIRAVNIVEINARVSNIEFE